MKNKILITVLAIMIVSILPSRLYANLTAQFQFPVISTEDYESVAGQAGTNVITITEFTNYLANGTNTNIPNPDDGYNRITLPWNYSFGSTSTNQIYVSVNGFITFKAPPAQLANDADGLFIDNITNHPDNVAAPFWGNHVYRNNQPPYTNSQILYNVNNDRAIIEWNNININEPTSGTITNPSSIANFQVIVYRSASGFGNNQGDIEFAYGLVNGSSGATVITQGASIGIKGNSGDYMNGLCFVDPVTNTARCNTQVTTTKSSLWQPSEGTNKRIRFRANEFVDNIIAWGDGDTDLSKNGRHFGKTQNRYVTFNDVRDIMRSIVTGVGLDSILGRQAYHADVDHDGRHYRVQTEVFRRSNYPDTTGILMVLNSLGTEFIPITTQTNRFDVYDQNGIINIFPADFFTNNPNYDPSDPTAATYSTQAGNLDLVLVVEPFTLTGDIPVRSRDANNLAIEYTLDLPALISSPAQEIFFRADEDDAKWIISYLKARITSLPWVYDTERNGKLNYVEQLANDISFGEAKALNNNQYEIPLYVNGQENEGISTFAKFDVEIENIKLVQENDNLVMADYNDGNLVIVGSGDFNSEIPVAYLYVNTDKSNINVNEVRFNDVTKSDKNISLNNSELINEVTLFGNPLVDKSTLVIVPNNSDNYQISLYDSFGKKIQNVFDGSLSAGSRNEFNFNGLDANGNILPNGVYIYKVQNSTSSETVKLIINK